MSTVRHLDAPPLRVGSRVRIKQPRLPAAEWAVTHLPPRVAFTWRSRSAGVTSDAAHRIEAVAEQRSRVTLSVHQRGLLAWLVGALFGRTAARHVALEAEGLKQRCEES